MNPKDKIKENLNILDVVGTYIKLEKSGKQYKACCPFHNEKTASFFVSPERGTYHCFGCGAHGDIFSFVERIESIPFYEALKILADRAGVKLNQFNQENKDKESHIISLLENAKKHFQENLSESPIAKKYLSDRGLNDEIIRKFEIGFSIGGNIWNDLFLNLSKKGFSSEDMIKAGLILKSEKSGNFYDRFRSRIMFPIKNNIGITVGFSGRILPEFDDGKTGKYINSPETEIYHKSKILFGYDIARKSIAEKKEVIIVEGQMDVIMSHFAGVENVVASSGTSFTDDQIKIIKRFADKVILSFDNDDAGENAMKKTAILCLFADLDTFVIPKIKIENENIKSQKIKDVADIVLNFGTEKWKEQIKKRIHIIDYLLENIFEKAENNLINKREINIEIKKEIFPMLKALQSDLDRAYFIKIIANRLMVDENILFNDLRNFKNLEPLKIENANTEIINTDSFSQPFKEILGIIKWKKIDEDSFIESNLKLENEILKDKIDFKKIFLENKKDIPEEIIEKEILKLENIFENNKDYKNNQEKFLIHILHDLFRNYKLEILQKIKQDLKDEENKGIENHLILISEISKEIQFLKNKKSEV